MKCAEVRSLLDDFIDELLPQYEQAAVEAHLRACPLCRDEEMRLAGLLDKARGLPRDIAPPQNSWPAIQARVLLDEEDRASVWKRFARPLLAGVAAVLLMTGAGFGFWFGAPAGRLAPAKTSDAANIDSAVALCAETQARLMRELERRKDELPPELYATVIANLRVIDGAILEIDLALQDDPENEPLRRLLVASHQKQVALVAYAISVSARAES